MNWRSIVGNRWFDFAVRLAIGGTFVYAGWIKSGEPQQFADNIASFRILPEALIVLLALGLPAFETLSGALLIIGWPRRVASLAVIMMCGIFLIALTSALARGIKVDCGCFGAGKPSEWSTWQDLGRDLLLLAGALLAYRFRSPAINPVTQYKTVAARSSATRLDPGL